MELNKIKVTREDVYKDLEFMKKRLNLEQYNVLEPIFLQASFHMIDIIEAQAKELEELKEKLSNPCGGLRDERNAERILKEKYRKRLFDMQAKYEDKKVAEFSGKVLPNKRFSSSLEHPSELIWIEFDSDKYDNKSIRVIILEE